MKFIVISTTLIWSRYRVVIIVTSYGLCPGFEARLVQENFLQNAQVDFGAHPFSFSMDTDLISWGVKRPGREVNHSPFSTKVKNEWKYAFAAPVCLHGVGGYNLTFFLQH
jgi:hypothetical protein